MSLDEDVKVVVKAINRLRKEAGLGRITKLKRGVPRSARACCIAMSLAETGIAKVQPMGYCCNERWYSWKHILSDDENAALKKVVRAFDDGKMPEYEMPKTPIKLKRPGQRKAEVIA